ncbi:MAG: DUF3179 domain-containing protein [Alphaproteobacteria bacterium]|nr:DUF3179 domain-containing protein [Alphaproteobacteria bacterium]
MKIIGAKAIRAIGMVGGIALLAVAVFQPAEAQRHFDPEQGGSLWPNTDFETHSVPFEEIFSGGVPRDGIPPIDDPMTDTISAVSEIFEDTEPVVTVAIGGEARAYPLGILTRHEIVNDELGGVPITVTFCPLCNSAVVFDRRVGDQVLDFGVSGMLRNSDLIMWDRQTESWWQQFLGEGIVGEMTGVQLTMLPVRVESFARFVERYPQGTVNVGSTSFGGFNVAYLRNPYVGYDQAEKDPASQDRPFLFFGDLPEEVAPLTYVVAVGEEAWTIDALRDAKRVEHNGLVLTWEPGQNSVMDAGLIREGHDLGNVTVQRKEGGTMTDVVHDVTFAFAFNAFRPDGVIYTDAASAAGLTGTLDAVGLSPTMAAIIGVIILVLLAGLAFRMFRKSAS